MRVSTMALTSTQVEISEIQREVVRAVGFHLRTVVDESSGDFGGRAGDLQARDKFSRSGVFGHGDDLKRREELQRTRLTLIRRGQSLWRKPRKCASFNRMC